MPTILLLVDDDPRGDPARDQFLAAHPSADVIHPAPGTDASRFARTCAAITAHHPDPPLVIVAIGEAALALPAVALAQRSAHRRVLEYVLVDPALPTVSDTWPDAPVVVVDAGSDASAQARLRGWTVLASVDQWAPPAYP